MTVHGGGPGGGVTVAIVNRAQQPPPQQQHTGGGGLPLPLSGVSGGPPPVGMFGGGGGVNQVGGVGRMGVEGDGGGGGGGGGGGSRVSASWEQPLFGPDSNLPPPTVNLEIVAQIQFSGPSIPQSQPAHIEEFPQPSTLNLQPSILNPQPCDVLGPCSGARRSRSRRWRSRLPRPYCSRHDAAIYAELVPPSILFEA
jgi:hypothetical protein